MSLSKPGIITRQRLRRHKGRAGGDTKPFALLPVELLTSPAVRTLPHVAHRVLVALAAQFYGKNNGSLTLARCTAAEYGIGDSHALGASLRELEARNLIICTRPSSQSPPRAARYAITWWPIDETQPDHPHELKPTLVASDGWRTWASSTTHTHWTTRRRNSRWRVPTAPGGAYPQENAMSGGAYPPENAKSLMAPTHRSDICRGRRA